MKRSASDQDLSVEEFDVVVIGAGIAGASVASELAANTRVALVEMESQPGYHTTGRSAAVFAPSYGSEAIRALTRASKPFFEAPPEGFADTPLFSPRRIMMIARSDQGDALDGLIETVSRETPVVELAGDDALLTHQPLLRPGYAARAMIDADGQDIDVGALHQGYLRRMRAAGGVLHTNATVSALTREGNIWCVNTPQRVLRAPVVINAAGAWAQHIGDLAGAEEVGLVPKRRTAMVVAEPEGVDAHDFPITIDVDEEFYLKPDAGRLLISPADETPVPPSDVQPEELDVAIGVDRIMTAFDLDIRRIDNKWAGLRSFVADKSPVAGFSQTAPGFFWLAGQGGYGIQTAPALARLAAAQVLGNAPAADILDCGLDLQSITPARQGLVN